jgi:hypothetical protein
LVVCLNRKWIEGHESSETFQTQCGRAVDFGSSCGCVGQMDTMVMPTSFHIVDEVG